MSEHCPSTRRLGAMTSALGNLTTFSAKNLFLKSSPNFFWCSFMLIPWILMLTFTFCFSKTENFCFDDIRLVFDHFGIIVTPSRLHITDVLVSSSLPEKSQGWALWGPPHCFLMRKECYICLSLSTVSPGVCCLSSAFIILNTVDRDLYCYLRLSEQIASVLLENIRDCIFCWLYYNIRSSISRLILQFQQIFSWK